MKAIPTSNSAAWPALGYIIIFCKMLTTQEIVNNFFWAGNSLKNNVCSVFIF